jgi:hypothetical protein
MRIGNKKIYSDSYVYGYVYYGGVPFARQTWAYGIHMVGNFCCVVRLKKNTVIRHYLIRKK